MASPRFITQPDEAAKELFRFVVDNPDEFPQDMRDQLLDLLSPGKSVAFAVSEGAELIYARREELSQRVLTLGAELSITASNNRINNFADNDGGRGRGIMEALRREAGEDAPMGISWPPKEDDPSPKDVYLPPVGSMATEAPAPEPQ